LISRVVFDLDEAEENCWLEIYKAEQVRALQNMHFTEDAHFIYKIE